MMPIALRVALVHFALQAAGAPVTGDAEPQADSELSAALSMMQASLQMGKAKPSLAADTPKRDLVFMHVPYNFGHTIEQLATFGHGLFSKAAFMALMSAYGGFSGSDYSNGFLKDLMPTPQEVLARTPPRPDGMMWGHLHPDLQVVSNVTGCPMYYTPAKYWPKDLAERYFGDRTIFGVLRDPYERLVAFFRGSLPGYGGSYPQYLSTCDVNSAVKGMMRRYLDTGNGFEQGCTFVPQAEYFDGEYGIQLPVNNRQFPESANKVFLEHGYPDMVIQTDDIMHVQNCPEKWAGDLDAETKQLVRRVYARDFELLCKHFGYCEEGENACIWRIPNMCPQRVIAAGYQG